MANKAAEISVEEKLKALYHVQLIDTQIDKLRAVRGELPIEVKDLENENSSQTRIIIMDVCGTLTGFIVDAVSEVIRIHSSEIQPPPPMVISVGLGQEFITGVFNHAERLLIIMDIDRMFSDTELDSFGEM